MNENSKIQGFDKAIKYLQMFELEGYQYTRFEFEDGSVALDRTLAPTHTQAPQDLAKLGYKEIGLTSEGIGW